VVLELIEEHTGQMDIGVTSSSGNVWHNIFNKEWLIEFVSIRTISEMECDVIRILLSISGKGYDDRAWHIYWLGCDGNVTIR
jgi:hypothetical protein